MPLIVQPPVLEIGLSGKDDSDAFATKAHTNLAAVARAMLFEPLGEPWVVFPNAFQLDGTGHILLLDTLDHCLNSGILNRPY